MRSWLAVRRFAALFGAALLVACAGEPFDDDRRQMTADVRPLPAPAPPSSTRDINNDGFINATEAAGFFARHFGRLDQDGDARLSREEMAPDIDDLDDPEATFRALDLDADRMISQDEYFQASSRRFRQRVNPASGMMSSSDFDAMIRRKDPLIADQLPDDPGA